MITCVLGAPGSGKSTVAGPLAAMLPGHAVLDWDALMGPAESLSGRSIREHPDTWPAYRELVRAVLDVMTPLPVVLLSPCTPDELAGWPIDAWVLLDCSNEERRQRLGSTADADQIDEAICDAQEYRSLGLPVIDTARRTPQAVAGELARFVARVGAGN